MKKVLVCEVLQRMLKALDNEQLKLLEKTLNECLVAVDVVSAKEQEQQEMDYISLFVSAKRIEGRSEKTLTYYKNTIDKMIEGIGKRPHRLLRMICVNTFLSTKRSIHPEK